MQFQPISVANEVLKGGWGTQSALAVQEALQRNVARDRYAVAALRVQQRGDTPLVRIS